MENQPPINDKGKRRATDSEQEAGDRGQQDLTTLFSRVVDSTKGLLRDTIGASHADASNTLLSNTELSGKTSTTGASSAATSLQNGVAVRTQPQGSTGTSSSSHVLADASLRSQHATSNTDLQFDQFVSNNVLGFEDANNAFSEPEHFDISQQTLASQAERFSTPNILPAEQVDYDDGAEVRALLADPNFAVHMNDTNLIEFEDSTEQTVDDLFPQKFSTEEQNAIDQLRKILPPPPIHKSTPHDHPLSLRPRSDAERYDIEQNIGSILSGTAGNDQLSTQTEQWLTEWTTALSSYTDEVWGDMLPIVQTTYAQLEEVKAGNATLDDKARARLKMILGHLQHHNV